MPITGRWDVDTRDSWLRTLHRIATIIDTAHTQYGPHCRITLTVEPSDPHAETPQAGAQGH